MYVLIAADGAWDQYSGVAGWGYYVSCKRGRAYGSGHLLFGLENNVETELTAIAQAIVFAYEQKLLRPGDRLFIDTDCTPVIDLFEGRNRKASVYERDLLIRIQTMLDGLHVRHEIRHVKAHSGIDSLPKLLNHNCDRLARKQLKLARSQLQTKFPTRETKAVN